MGSIYSSPKYEKVQNVITGTIVDYITIEYHCLVNHDFKNVTPEVSHNRQNGKIRIRFLNDKRGLYVPISELNIYEIICNNIITLYVSPK